MFGIDDTLAAALDASLVTCWLRSVELAEVVRRNDEVADPAGTAGFSGDIELLLAGIGLVFLLVGAGGWSLEGGIRRSRVRRKQEAEF
ncbi:MAG: hypothetical protein L0H88_08035 [Propionibacterium sp.]|nr:hypothetical protein [Propionibacterium sp.]